MQTVTVTIREGDTQKTTVKQVDKTSKAERLVEQSQESYVANPGYWESFVELYVGDHTITTKAIGSSPFGARGKARAAARALVAGVLK